VPSVFRVTDRTAPDRAVDPNVRETASTLSADAASRTPVRTGRLRRGWRVARDRDGVWVVGNDVEYARFVEYGTRRNRPAAMMGQALARARAATRR
jgi:hypothetical protein